jgi:hypothetical protein
MLRVLTRVRHLAIVIDWPEQRVQKIPDLLEAKCPNYIEVIEFDEADDDEDDEDDE